MWGCGVCVAPRGLLGGVGVGRGGGPMGCGHMNGWVFLGYLGAGCGGVGGRVKVVCGWGWVPC